MMSFVCIFSDLTFDFPHLFFKSNQVHVSNFQFSVHQLSTTHTIDYFRCKNLLSSIVNCTFQAVIIHINIWINYRLQFEIAISCFDAVKWKMPSFQIIYRSFFNAHIRLELKWKDPISVSSKIQFSKTNKISFFMCPWNSDWVKKSIKRLYWLLRHNIDDCLRFIDLNFVRNVF